MARDVREDPTRVEGYPYRGGPVLDIEHTDAIPPAPPPPPRGRGAWPWLLALLVLVLLGLGAVYAFAHRAGPSSERGAGLAAPPSTTPTKAKTTQHAPRARSKKHKKLVPAIPVKKHKPAHVTRL